MNIKLQHLLPANSSNEAIYHIVKFVKDLALALEFTCFEQMLHHTSTCDYDPFSAAEEDKEVDNDPPF